MLDSTTWYAARSLIFTDALSISCDRTKASVLTHSWRFRIIFRMSRSIGT